MNDLASLKTYEAAWRKHIEDLGYNQLNLTVTLEPVNDRVTITMFFYDDDYSSTHLPTTIKNGTFGGFASTIVQIDRWVATLKPESEQRDIALLTDFVKIKERIAKSNLSAIIKADADALLKQMTTNILPAPDDVSVDDGDTTGGGDDNDTSVTGDDDDGVDDRTFMTSSRNPNYEF